MYGLFFAAGVSDLLLQQLQFDHEPTGHRQCQPARHLLHLFLQTTSDWIRHPKIRSPRGYPKNGNASKYCLAPISSVRY